MLNVTDLNLLKAKRKFHPDGRPVTREQAHRMAWRAQRAPATRRIGLIARLKSIITRSRTDKGAAREARGPRSDGQSPAQYLNRDVTVFASRALDKAA